MFEILHEQRARQDVDERIRRASRQRLVARVKRSGTTSAGSRIR